MRKVYGGPRTRACVVYWYLEELGLPYEPVPVSLRAGEQRKPEYLAIHPIGKVPALDDDGVKVWESGAILLYLAEKYGNMPADPASRAPFYAWVVYANATLTPAIEGYHADAVTRVVAPLEPVLAGREYLIGQELTVADVAVGAMLAWSSISLGYDYRPYPAVIAYRDRLRQRPAFQRGMEPAL